MKSNSIFEISLHPFLLFVLLRKVHVINHHLLFFELSQLLSLVNFKPNSFTFYFLFLAQCPASLLSIISGPFGISILEINSSSNSLSTFSAIRHNSAKSTRLISFFTAESLKILPPLIDFQLNLFSSIETKVVVPLPGWPLIVILVIYSPPYVSTSNASHFS